MVEHRGDPGLRERVTAVVCEGWPSRDNELPAAAIRDRLEGDGQPVSDEALRDVLGRMASDGDITLVLATTPPPSMGPTVRGVSPELCP